MGNTTALLARYRELITEAQRRYLASWERDELVRIMRALGPLVLDA